MTVTLDTLELVPDELKAAYDAIQRMAYYNWLDWGCPDGRALDCWLEAERRWIEHSYVPNRHFAGTCPPCPERPESLACDEPNEVEQPLLRSQAVAGNRDAAGVAKTSVPAAGRLTKAALGKM